MKINITKKQYQHLLELVYLGEWTANASKENDERNHDYDEFQQYIFSFAKNFGFEEDVMFDKKSNVYYPTNELEERMDDYIQANDEDVFWQQLTLRLAKRDAQKEKRTFATEEDYLKRLLEIEEKYEKEFKENGIERLTI